MGKLKPRFEWCDPVTLLISCLKSLQIVSTTGKRGVAQIFSANRFESWISINQKRRIVFRSRPLSKKRNRRSRFEDESELLASLALRGGGLPPGLLLPGQLGQHQHRLCPPPTHGTVSDWARPFSVWTPGWRLL